MKAHTDKNNRCLTCHEHGAPYDGPCDSCGYYDRRWSDDRDAEVFNRFHHSSATMRKDVGEGDDRHGILSIGR